MAPKPFDSLWHWLTSFGQQNPAGDYRLEGDAALIELELDTPPQLFNTLDPSPFRLKDLDPDAETYIIGAAREFPLAAPLKLLVHLPAPVITPELGEELRQAVHHYFAYRAEVTARELRFELHLGRLSLAIGLAFLILCVVLRQVVFVDMTGTLARIIAEGLLICGWVAMWRPLQIFLYDWWPQRFRHELERKLAQIPVEVRPKSST